MRNVPLVAVGDDDESLRDATQDLSKAAGYRAATFEDAESFLRSAIRPRVACVIADMRMPGMTRLEMYLELEGSELFVVGGARHVAVEVRVAEGDVRLPGMWKLARALSGRGQLR